MFSPKFANVGRESIRFLSLPPPARRRWPPPASLLAPPPRPPATLPHPVESGRPRGRALSARLLRRPGGCPSPRSASPAPHIAWPYARLLPELQQCWPTPPPCWEPLACRRA